MCLCAERATQAYDIKQQDFGFSQPRPAKCGPMRPLIATAAQYGVALAQRLVNTRIASNIHQFGRMVNDTNQLVAAAEHFSGESAQLQHLVRLLSAWDLGLSDVQVRAIETALPMARRTSFGCRTVFTGLPMVRRLSCPLSYGIERHPRCLHAAAPPVTGVAVRRIGGD